MFSYSDLIKQAYRITRHFPILWLFGMFVVGVFNLNFFQFQNWPQDGSIRLDAPAAAAYLTAHPGRLAVVSLTVLGVSAVSLILTNWSRIMLMLTVKSLLDKRVADLGKQARESKTILWPFIKVSILTAVFMLAALAVLAAPWWINVGDPALENMLWLLGIIIFFPLAFTISCINIFTGMFLVLFRMPLGKALNAGTDFFASNWIQILALSLILVVIYLAGFVLGVSLLGLLRVSLRIALLSFSRVGLLHFSAVLVIIKALGVLTLWILLGILNAFLNTVLLLFFLQKVTPVKTEDLEVATQAAPSPAVP